jgi:type IV pilus assembly protein PilY1
LRFNAATHTLRRLSGHRVGLLVGLVTAGAVGLLAGPGLSGEVPVPGEAACCTSATVVGDAMIHTPTGGDKDFFAVPSGPANAIFLLSNYESMQEYAEYLPEVGDTTKTGCSDPALVAAMSWVDIHGTDPKRNGATPIDPDPDFHPVNVQFFDPDKYYNSRGWRLALNGWDWPYTLESDYRSTVGSSDLDSICYPHTGWDPNSAIHKECKQCLLTKGWWRGNLHSDPSDPKLPNAARRKWLLSGRVLNVRPPKFVVARKVLKDVISTADNLRMGVAIFGKDRGWYDPPEILQPLRPACNESHPILVESALMRSEMLKSINRVSFNHYERSIGEALFGLGGYYSSQAADQRWTKWFTNPISPGFGWPGGWNGGTDQDPITLMEGNSWGYDSVEWHKPGQSWEAGGQQRSVCFSCQANSVIVLTDGAPKFDNSVPVTRMMEILLANKATHPDGTLLTFDPSDPRNNTNPGGVNYCDKFGTTKEACDYANWPTGFARTNKNFMDDVAFFLSHMDLRDDMEGEQSVRTYTIGYGDNSPMLQSIAMAGKGEFYRVNNPTELRDALMAAIDNIKEVSTSFGAANISGVQAGGMQSSVYVPRFIPRRDQPYEGHLYRFFFYNEFTQGCEPARARSTGGDTHDLNRDKDCDDIFFLDKPADLVVTPGSMPSVDEFGFTAANIIQENAEGRWVKVSTATVNAEGRLEGGKPAEPFWDVAETLDKRSASDSCNPDSPTGGRCVFTLIDRNKDGRFDSEDNPPVPFEVAQRDKLKGYLLAAGDGFCMPLFARQKKAWVGTAAQQLECVDTLIRFVRGVDVFDLDGDGNSTEDQPCADNDKKSCKLADIFHSSPVLVEQPIEPFLCSLGLSTQCVSTLYEDFSATVTSETLCSAPGAPKPCYAATPMEPKSGSPGYRYGAYDEFREQTRTRPRVVLVGSNGGMLHAIHAGKALSRDKDGPLDDIFDLGTGQELWAFIPPDLLPKLGMMVNGHEYFVDGTPMVRDIWADGEGSKPGVKETKEFHTLAIISERSGGQRFLALDVTDPLEMLKPDGRPFRWMFPNACEPEAATMGQTWANFAPKPPPIGPVRIAADNTRGWDEQWVTLLNGGYSADLSRGRGVYMVDAWTGQKLWSAEAKRGSSATGQDYKDEVIHRMMPVVASPAMVDLGKAEDIRMDMDGFFDTLVVGDLGGQVWTFRFHTPGTPGNGGIISNWYGARSLEIAREDVSGFDAPRNAWKKTPFFHIASNVRQPDTGWLRSYLGSGDRQNLRDKEDTSCGPDNLLACIRLKCDVRAEYQAHINGQLRTTLLRYDNGVLVEDSGTSSVTGQHACSSARMELTGLTIQCDNATALGSGTYRYPAAGSASTEAECSGSGTMWSCSQARLSTDSHGDLKLGTDADLVPRNRYYGFLSYGGTKRGFKSELEAIAFDKRRITDIPFTCEPGVQCSLVDVTIPDSAYANHLGTDGKTVRYLPASKLASLARGTAEGPGWFIQYDSLTEKTAAGSSVLGGVVFWPSFNPPTASPTSACKLSGAGDTGRSWQADVITGLPDQSEGFRLLDEKGALLGYLPNKSRAVFAPPPEPASVISMSKTGGIRYQVAVTGAGEQPTTETLRTRPNVTPDISWMVVPRNLHQCRHVDDRDCFPSEPSEP